MNNKDIVLESMREKGRTDAIDLRNRAVDMTGTAIIDEEQKAPIFINGKDYSEWPVGSPVESEEQIWKLIQPYNSKANPGNPSTLRALWGLCHTKNPTKAKQWVDPLGTSGAYQKEECYKDVDGKVYRCKRDHTVHDAKWAPTSWEEVL